MHRVGLFPSDDAIHYANVPAPVTETQPPNRLRDLREAADESRVVLASALGLNSERQIWRWESGEQEIPAKYLRSLAQRYKVSISHLLRDENGDYPEAA